MAEGVVMEKIEQTVKISVTNDGLQAYMTIEEAPADSSVLGESVAEALNQAGVVYGVKKGILKNLHKVRPGTRVLIAEGEEPKDGADGYVHFMYEKYPEGSEKYFPLNNVTRDAVIAVLHPPCEGKPGRTVRGTIIKQKVGKKATLRAGANTVIESENPVTIKAAADGHAVYQKDGRLEIMPVVTIEGDIDGKTGIIEFTGSVVVKGNVNSGARISVNGDLTVSGNVRDAVITAGGNVSIKEGFIGQGDGKITAKGDVTLPHVWNQKIETEGNVELLRESVGGVIVAGGRINAKKATIAGGLLEADKEVVINNLGCGESSQGKVRVGSRGRTLERLAGLNKEMQQYEKQKKEVQDAILRLSKMKIELGKLPVDKQGLFDKLKAVKEAIPQRLAELDEEHKHLSKKLQSDYDSRVEVRGIVRENVIIEVNGARRLIEDEIEGVIFRERHNVVEIEGI
jgi:uncharacterized protein